MVVSIRLAAPPSVLGQPVSINQCVGDGSEARAHLCLECGISRWNRWDRINVLLGLLGRRKQARAADLARRAPAII